MKLLLAVADKIDWLNERVGRLVSWVTALLVAVVFTDVVMRYAFSISFVFTQELEWHLFAFIFLIGSGYTLLYEGHVRVDIIYQRVSPKTRAWLNVAGCIFFLAPGCFLIIYTSIGFVADAIYTVYPDPKTGEAVIRYIWEGSPDPGGVPLRFILKSCIPVGFTLLFLQGCSMFIRNLNVILGGEPALQAGGHH